MTMWIRVLFCVVLLILLDQAQVHAISTYLIAEAPASSSALALADSTGLQANDKIQIGLREIRTIQAVSGADCFLTAPTSFLTPVNTQVKKLESNDPVLLAGAPPNGVYVDNITFADQDVDSAQVGGPVTWDPPSDASIVTYFTVYFAETVAGWEQTHVGELVPVGTNSMVIPADISWLGNRRYVLVYTGNPYGKQAESASTPHDLITDIAVSAAGVSFDDLDLDTGDLGGTVAWTEPSATDLVDLYQVDFATAVDGTGRSVLANTSLGTNITTIPADTAKGSFTHILVYIKSPLAEQTTPANVAINDAIIASASIAFVDRDLDSSQIGGAIIWSASIGIAPVQSFQVYAAQSSSGSGRLQFGGDLTLTDTTVDIPADTPTQSFTHVVLYARSTLAEQTTPAASSALNDVSSSVSAIEFLDRDLDGNELGGTLSWTAPGDISQVSKYDVYLSVDASGLTSKSQAGSSLSVGTNAMAVPVDTSYYPFFVVYSRSTLAEQTTPVAVAVSDAAAQASAITFQDLDLDSTDLGGMIEFVGVADASQVERYMVYFAEAATGENRSQIGDMIDVEANETNRTLNMTVYHNTPMGSLTHIVIYVQSSLAEQTTPASASLSDAVARVSAIDFVDLDLDSAEVGGALHWNITGDVDLILGYDVFLSSDPMTSKQTRVGDGLAYGTNEVAVAVNSPKYLVIYTRSALVEQTTPFATTLFDRYSVVSNIAFTDQDLDPFEVGGQLSWERPADISQVIGYDVYFADNVTGEGGLRIGGATLDGSDVTSVQVPAETALSTYQYFVIYTRSSLAEQTTPAFSSVVDLNASVSNVTFVDQDLDANELGGTASWSDPEDVSQVSAFGVYLSTDAVGSSRAQLGGGPLALGNLSVQVPADTAKSSFTYLVVYCSSDLAEQGTPVSFEIVDTEATVSSIVFLDLDLDLTELGGTLSWSAPASIVQVLHYSVYLADGAVGQNRMQVASAVAVGTNSFDLPADTSLQSRTHIVAYTSSALAEQTTPAGVAVSDNSASVSGVELNDRDLDPDEFGGPISWTAPSDTTHVTRYVLYLATSLPATVRSLVDSPQTVGYNQLILPANTNTSWAYAVVYTLSSLTEQTTPSAVLMSDRIALVSSITLSDQDLDKSDLGGTITWMPPNDVTQVISYMAYLSSDSSGSGRSLIGSAVSVGTNVVSLAANTAVRNFALIYTRSALAEQSTPAAAELNDTAAEISQLSLVDQDLDGDELGGNVTWNPPTDDSEVIGYVVHVLNYGPPYQTAPVQSMVPAGTNFLEVPADFQKLSWTYLTIYASSALAEQSTPTTVEILNDTIASVSDLDFADLDLDISQVGGNISWNSPLDTSEVTEYLVYLATSTKGASRSQVGGAVAVNSGDQTQVFPDTAKGSLTHFVVYTKSELAEQTTPQGKTLDDTVAAAVSVQFTDLDLDSNEAGGPVTWIAPPGSPPVIQYMVYLSASAAGAGRDSGTAVSFGTNLMNVPADTAISSPTLTHVTIYTMSTLAEQTTPSYIAFDDKVASVGSVLLRDRDLDVGELGGQVTWNPPPFSLSLVSTFNVYFADDAVGSNRSAIVSAAPQGTNVANVVADTPASTYTHLLVYTQSSFVEQTTPATHVIADEAVVLGNLAFSDLDLDGLELGGVVQWVPQLPVLEAELLNLMDTYNVYLASSSAGASNTSIGSVSAGTNSFTVAKDTACEQTSTHIVVFASSSLAEQSTPAAVNIIDLTVAIANISFTDLDLDFGEVGGILTWDPPGELAQIVSYYVYFANEAFGDRSQIGSALGVGTNQIAVPANTIPSSSLTVVVYAASSLTEQTTPGALNIADELASVSAIQFVDLDLDPDELGGNITWEPPPPANVSLVVQYDVYLARNSVGSGKFSVGGLVPVGINEASLSVDTSMGGVGGFTHVVVYTESSLCEQTTPAFKSIADTIAVVSSVSFTDYDLDSNELGGVVTWTEPGNTAQVDVYNVYLAMNLAGGGRFMLQPPTEVHQSDFNISADTNRLTRTHIVVYASSSLAEQSTPGGVALADTSEVVTGGSFVDEDLDAEELGGYIQWSTSSPRVHLTEYVIYFAESSVGLNRSQITAVSASAVPAGVGSLGPSADMPLESFTHLLVYTRSAFFEQTTPFAISLTDNLASVSSITYVDGDLDYSELGGAVSWTPPTNVAQVTHYHVYLAEGNDGVNRSQLGTPQEGTNTFVIAANTAVVSFSHVLIYTKSSLFEQTTPAPFSIEDVNASVSELNFADQDLDATQLGGMVTWELPESIAQVAKYNIYLATSAEGQDKSLVGNTNAAGNAILLPAESAKALFTHVVVYTESTFVEQTTPVSVEILDTATPVSNVAFPDTDLDAGEVGGNVTWVAVGDVSQVTQYAAYLAKSPLGADRSQIAAYVAEGTTLIALDADSPRAAWTYVSVYAKSPLAWQSTPVSIVLVDTTASVSSVSFPDDDLDESEVGGSIIWDAPADMSQVVGYNAYFATNAVGSGRSQIGGFIDAGTNNATVLPETIQGASTHVVVYTASLLAEQTTPVAILLEQGVARAYNINLWDRDLDLGEIGDLLYWTPPGGTPRVSDYIIYIASDASGNSRSRISDAVAWGTNAVHLPADIFLGGRTYIVIYTQSPLVEQTTPGALQFVDKEALAVNIQFKDLDLDEGQLGGTVTWNPPSDTSMVLHYTVYFAQNETGRSQIGAALPLGTNVVFAEPDAVDGGYVAVYTKSALAEQTTPARIESSDSVANGADVEFADDDLDLEEIGGPVTWVPRGDESMVTYYWIYIAPSADGTGRSRINSMIVGTNVLTIPAEIRLDLYSYVLVYTASSLVEQTTPNAVAINDTESFVIDLAFPDQDLDDNELGGSISWDLPPNQSRVVGYDIYLAATAAGAYRSQIGSPLALGTNEATVLPETRKSGHQYVVAYARSALAEKTTPVALKFTDTSVLVSDLSFVDQDLDGADLGGAVTWNPPAVETHVTGYFVYFSEGGYANAVRTFVSGGLPPGTNQTEFANLPYFGFSHIVVFASSSVAEQTTPAHYPIHDTVASVTGVAFADYDLDPGDFGGTVTWQPPANTNQVKHYVVYFAESSVGLGRSLVAGELVLGTNAFAIFPDTAAQSFNNLIVYTASSFIEQSTPTALAVSDYAVAVNGLTLKDADLDELELGGKVTWSPPVLPTQEPTRVHEYSIHLAEDAAGLNRSTLGVTSGSSGVTQISLSADLALGDWTHIVIYARSTLAEQTSPAGTAAIVDYTVLVTDIVFADADLDFGEIGGRITWQAPIHASMAERYYVYLGLDVAGSNRSLVGSAPLGAGAYGTVDTSADLDTASNTHILIYSASDLFEQTTPGFLNVIDHAANVTSVAFPDDDLDESEFGGYVTWTPPDDSSRVTHYYTYLAQGPAGESRVGPVSGAAVAVGSNSVLLPMNTANQSYSHVVVYTKSWFAEQTTPTSEGLHDNAVELTDLAMLDLDLDVDQIGGDVTWNPIEETRVIHYAVYLSGDGSGSDPIPAVGESGQTAHQVATNLLSILPDTSLRPVTNTLRTHIVIFAASQLAEQTTPAASLPIADVARAVSNVRFVDLDLDQFELGGTLIWDPPADATHVASYVAYLSLGLTAPRVQVGSAVPVGTHQASVPTKSPTSPYTHLAVFTRSTLAEQTTPSIVQFQDTVCTSSSLFFSDQGYESGEISGVVTWQPPSDASLVAYYALYLADDAEGSNREVLGEVTDGRRLSAGDAGNVTVGTNEFVIPQGTQLGPHTHLVLYIASSLAEQDEPIGIALSDLFQGQDVLRVSSSAGAPQQNASIEAFTFVGCYESQADISDFGEGALVTFWTGETPATCADVCFSHETFAVGNNTCICTYSSRISYSLFLEANRSSCDAPCNGWSRTDFPAMASHFSSVRGYCGGNLTGVWSIYEQYDAVSAVGPGIADRSRGLYWQIVLLQVFTGGGGDSDQSEYYNATSWQWHVHASSLSSGRAAFPVHRQLDQPIFGLMIEEHSENPRLLGTTAQGDVVAVYVGSLQTPQRVLNGTVYPDHVVDGTPVEPGAALVAALDEQRGMMFTTQPIGAESSQLYGIPLELSDDFPYTHIRFVPFCDLRWCYVNEIRFRYRGEEIDLSTATTYFYDDLSDAILREGAILIDFAVPTMVDEFSVSMPYNTTSADPVSWVLEGTTDRIRKCVMSGSPETQSMPDGMYIQNNGEHRQNRPVYRALTGEILYWDDNSGSWWVSPKIRNGGYGAIRCVGNVFEPHLLNEASCVAWDGRIWDAAPNVTFDCYGNTWTTLHLQTEYYPTPQDRTAPLRWFKISRNYVNWSSLIDNITGHTGLLVSDPRDGYLAATTTGADIVSLRTLGRPTDSNCIVTSNVTFESLEGSASQPMQIGCAATGFRVGAWSWPDAEGSLGVWFSCATPSEFAANPWIQGYVQSSSDANFGWSSLQSGSGGHLLKAQWIRTNDVSVMSATAWFDGALDYFVCPIQDTCTTVSSLNVRLIPASGTCGCTAEVPVLETHGFYKACYCLPDAPRSTTRSVSCLADHDFNALAGTVLGMGPEPARLIDLTLVLGQSWAFGISDTTSTFSGVYRAQLEYAAGDLFANLGFPSTVSLTNATNATTGCGFNPSACDLVGEVVCTLGESCLARLNGTSLQEYNGLKVARSMYGCVARLKQPYLASFENMDNPKPNCTRTAGVKPGYRAIHVWDFGRPTRGVLAAVTATEPGPGVYTLCWGSNPLDNETYSESEAYSIDAGYFIMMGPFAMDFECSLHFPCTFKISGIGLANTNKVLFIESALGRCGMPNVQLPDAEWSGVTNPSLVQDSDGEHFNMYTVGTAMGKSGASHRLCWAHAPPEENYDGTPISDYSSLFRVEIDPDFFWVRFTAHVQCILGRECIITLFGVGMSPSNQILLVTMNSECGSPDAVPISVVGLTNPQQVIDPGVPSSSVGVYLLSTSTAAAPPAGFRICWSPNPLNSSATNFPLEIFYPVPYPAAVFFEHRVGGIGLVRLESNRRGQHKALAVYGQTTKLPAQTVAWSAFDARLDYECCANAGFATSAVLDILADIPRPLSSQVFQDRPTDDFAAAALSVRNPRVQGLQCGEACGDEFTSPPTDYVLAAAYRDLANPKRTPGAAMLLKVEPRGPQWARTWAAQRAPQHFYARPPQGIADHSVEARQCATSDPLATCSFVSRDRVQSIRIVALSPTRLLATFVEGSDYELYGKAVVINVVHHLPNEWEFNTGLKTVFHPTLTSNVDLAALTPSTAIVAYSDENWRRIKTRIIKVNGDGTDDVTLGEEIVIGSGNMTLNEEERDALANETNVTNATNATWKYTATHRRLSVCALSPERALVAFGPIDQAAEVVLIVISQGTGVRKAVSRVLNSDNIDDVNIVPLGTTKKALAVYRDEADGGVGKALEVDVYDDYNGASFEIGPGSLVTFTSFRTESLTAIGLNGTAVLIAYRAMDGSEQGRTQILHAAFNQ